MSRAHAPRRRLRSTLVRATAGAQRLGRRAGLDVRRYIPASSFAARRARIMACAGIDLVLDVGANEGQYGRELRANGYGGRLVSLEPQSAAFRALAAEAARDPAWEARRLALLDADDGAVLHVAGNLVSSSVLPMTRRHELSAPDSAYVGVEHVEARRLDSLAPELLGDASRVLLKLDVQGAELRALSGAEASLRRIVVVEMELSLVPLYDGGALMREALDRLDAAGYDLVGLEPGFSDPSSGRLLQADGLFARRGA